ncbi:hypothetical protein Adt_14122 [Abeliophyllum distichum]|uniref:Uncharacterized protein n=1 Tax=Abeliophyllum distichum TaxID=126358 RepID=A0ABD1TYR3_9LAMI
MKKKNILSTDVKISVPLINSSKENMAAIDSDFINCCDSNLIVASCSENVENMAENQEQVTQSLELENVCQNFNYLCSDPLSTTAHTTFLQIEIPNLHENQIGGFSDYVQPATQATIADNSNSEIDFSKAAQTSYVQDDIMPLVNARPIRDRRISLYLKDYATLATTTNQFPSEPKINVGSLQ